MDQKELDSLLQVIENPVRRRIIKRLSQEPGYALQLSKELGLGQPLVAKHLSIMENARLVTSTMESSATGPRRKKYSLSRSISITMDLAPNLFLERGVAFGDDVGTKGTPRGTGHLPERVEDAVSGPRDKERLSHLAHVLQDVDVRMKSMEEERVDLLAIRNKAMMEAARIVTKLELDKKRVLFYILDVHEKEAEKISESLNLREFTVKAILEELERDYFG
jgi:predicted transcriptional regulator